MSLVERIVVRLLLVGMLAVIVYVFRLIKVLLKKGWQKLTGSTDAPRKEPGIQAKQPPKPPVTPGQTAKSPVVPQNSAVPQPPKPPVVPQNSAVPQPPKPPVVPQNSAVPQPPKPPVVPQNPVVPQPPKPPVVPQNPAVPQPPKSPVATGKPQEYKGTVPLDPGGTIPLVGQQSSGSGYSLRCVRGPMQGHRFPIPAEGCTIGRNPTSTIRFPAQTPGVSGNHCRIEAMYFCQLPFESGYDIYLRDVGSTYGTYSGFGQRIQPGEQYPLHPGEAFFLGNPNGPGFVLEKQ